MAFIELEDTKWFPQILRDQQLEYIGWLVDFLDIYQPIVDPLSQWITLSDATTVQDLCSGSGEPMISLSQAFPKDISVTLSDKFVPGNPYNSSSILYTSDSVDVLDLVIEPSVYYTMFNAFHHFDKSEQQKIIRNLIDKKAPFCFVEILQPNIITLLKVILGNTLGQLLLAPFVQPFSLMRLAFTYLLPINILTTTYDGIISVIKSKNKKEYQTLLQHLLSEKYQIEVNQLDAPYFNKLLVIQGSPSKSNNI